MSGTTGTAVPAGAAGAAVPPPAPVPPVTSPAALPLAVPPPTAVTSAIDAAVATGPAIAGGHGSLPRCTPRRRIRRCPPEAPSPPAPPLPPVALPVRRDWFSRRSLAPPPYPRPAGAGGTAIGTSPGVATDG